MRRRSGSQIRDRDGPYRCRQKRMPQQTEPPCASGHDCKQLAFSYTALKLESWLFFHHRGATWGPSCSQSACLPLRACSPAGSLSLRQAWVGVCARSTSAPALNISHPTKPGHFIYHLSVYLCIRVNSIFFLVGLCVSLFMRGDTKHSLHHQTFF